MGCESWYQSSRKFVGFVTIIQRKKGIVVVALWRAGETLHVIESLMA
jgi:hypothetical protein